MAAVDRIVRCPYDPDMTTINIASESLAETLWKSLESNFSKTAMVAVGSSNNERITYGELLERASLVARRLSSHGCQRQDVVAIFAPNSISWVVAYLATCRLGAVPAAVNSLLTADELRHQLRTADVKFMFTVKELLSVSAEATKSHKLKAIFASGSTQLGCIDIEATGDPGELIRLPPLPSFQFLNIQPDDPAGIFFSSGTTGAQKAVLLSNHNIQYTMAVARHPKGSLVYPDQVAFAPFSHATGGFGVLIMLVAGSTIHFLSKFDFEEFMRSLHEEKMQMVFVVPPIAIMMVKNPIADKYKLTELRDVLVGAAPLSVEVEDQLIERYPGIIVRQGYGMTESSLFITFTPLDRSTYVRKPGTSGPPIPGLQMKVVDLSSGEALGPGQRGEIWAKSPGVMLRYVNNPQATAETVDSDGWLHTGDIGYYDEDGYIFIVDRLKELIKYKAYQVPPAELEAVLLSHPDVSDAGVIGVPDAAAGEVPLAWVVKKPNTTVTEQQLQQFVDGKVSSFKRLRGGVQFVASIPRIASGKISRKEIKAAVLKGKL